MTEKHVGSSPTLVLAPLLLGWVGLWGAWLTHETAALTQNVIDFAEWATYLNDVRYGALTNVPAEVRAAVGLFVLALAVSAGETRYGWLRWIARAMALFVGVLLLPPYPGAISMAGLNLWLAFYRPQFIISMVVLVGVPLSVLFDFVPSLARHVFAGLLLIAVLWVGWGAYRILLDQFSVLYAAALPVGWGAWMFFTGALTGLVLHGWSGIRQVRRAG